MFVRFIYFLDKIKPGDIMPLAILEKKFGMKKVPRVFPPQPLLRFARPIQIWFWRQRARITVEHLRQTHHFEFYENLVEATAFSPRLQLSWVIELVE